MKTADLSGAALDYWVAKAEGMDPERGYDLVTKALWWQTRAGRIIDTSTRLKFSSDWALGGPIIEREAISVYQDPHWYGGHVGTPRWLAGYSLRAQDGQYYSTLTGGDPSELDTEHTAGGDTYLVAAMRARVTAKFGPEVEDILAPK